MKTTTDIVFSFLTLISTEKSRFNNKEKLYNYQVIGDPESSKQINAPQFSDH